MTKLTEQQEAFCRYVVEGMSQTDAYEKAGYKGNRKSLQDNAARLIGTDRIQSRIAELRQNASEGAEVTLEWLIRESVDLYRQAKKEGAHAAANATLKTVGVYTGFWNEKSTRENINRDADQLTDDELAHLARAGRSRAAEQEDGEGESSRVH